MKIRSGFVSNSSSSSFVVALSVLTEEEKQKILNYEISYVYSQNALFRDEWSINVDERRGVILGFTSMDNGDLCKYLGEELSSKCVFEQF